VLEVFVIDIPIKSTRAEGLDDRLTVQGDHAHKYDAATSRASKETPPQLRCFYDVGIGSVWRGRKVGYIAAKLK
jgi:hypothetical protein